MKIAIMGIRGIPACYGGFETFAEELAGRLAQKGHQVTVYGRSNIIKGYKTGDYYKGVRLVILPTISHKYFDTAVSTFLSVCHSLVCRYDLILMCNATNSIFSFVPRLTGQKVVINVDGLERKRKKWGPVGKALCLLGEFLSTIFPNEIVTDVKVVEEYYLKKYHKRSQTIVNGASVQKVATREILEKLGLNPEGYVLYVSRLEPENNAHVVIAAFEKVRTDLKLVIVGDAPYSSDYISRLKKTTDPRIIFTGFIFGQGYKELQSNAFCYVHASEVGGTPPALIESMGLGNCVIANSTPENIEVAGEAAIFYKKNDPDDLAQKIQLLVDLPETRMPYQERAIKRVREKYSWGKVAEKYESLFQNLVQH